MIRQGCGLALGLLELPFPGIPDAHLDVTHGSLGAPALAPENASFSAALSLGGVSKVCPRTVPKQQRKLNSLLTAFAWVVVAMVDCVPVLKNDFS